MTKGVKEGKGKYEKNINSLLDGIHCAWFIAQRMAESKAMENDAELAVAYNKGKKCFERLKKYNFQQLQITMEEQKPEILEEIIDLTSVIPVQFLEKTKNIETDIRLIQPCLISEIYLDGKYVRDGSILSSGEFIFSTRSRKGNDECFIYNKYGELTKTISTLSRPFGIIENMGEIILTCSDSKYMKVFNSYNLNCNKTTRLTARPYGIALSQYLYVACGDKIIKINKDGRLFATFHIGPSVKHITSTSSNIVYSNRKTNEVVAMDRVGITKWRYSSPDLRSPCGLSVDGEDNIYVAGKESDNVHVLTKDGQFVRVFEDITRPDFMKVDKERKLCFVDSMRKYVKVYEML